MKTHLGVVLSNQFYQLVSLFELQYRERERERERGQDPTYLPIKLLANVGKSDSVKVT